MIREGLLQVVEGTNYVSSEILLAKSPKIESSPDGGLVVTIFG
jgi:hypothetical protein